MRILVYGAGVIGCSLASGLLSGKKDVTLLARGEWADEIEEMGLCFRSCLRPGRRKVDVKVIRTLSPSDCYDVIFVAVRFTSLESVISVLKANESRTVVFIGNNTKVDECLDALPGRNVMFAFVSAAGHREKDCVYGIDLKKITIGSTGNSPSYGSLIGRIFEGTEYRVTVEDNMGDYLLSHAAFVVPAAFACYFTDGNLRKIAFRRKYIDRIIDASVEGYSALEKAGVRILPDNEDFRSRRYRRICRILYRLIALTKIGRVCVCDHAMNAVEEMTALNRDLRKIFASAGQECGKWRKMEKDAEKYIGKPE